MAASSMQGPATGSFQSASPEDDLAPVPPRAAAPSALAPLPSAPGSPIVPSADRKKLGRASTQSILSRAFDVSALDAAATTGPLTGEEFKEKMQALIFEYEKLEGAFTTLQQSRSGWTELSSPGSPFRRPDVFSSDECLPKWSRNLTTYDECGSPRSVTIRSTTTKVVPVRPFFQEQNSRANLAAASTNSAIISRASNSGTPLLKLLPNELLESSKPLAWRLRALDPNARARITLDTILLVLCVYDGIMVPFSLAWRPSRDLLGIAISVFSAFFWLSDMAMNFFTSYYKNGILVTDLRKVAFRYLFGPFFLDVAVNGADIVSIWMELASDGTNASLRIFRLLKLSRLARVLVVLRKVSQKRKLVRVESSSMTMLSLGGRLVAILLFLNHLLCCFWFFLGTSDWQDTEKSWLDMSIQSGGLQYRDASWEFQYLTALHWSFTQMTPGSMSVVPQNSFERSYNILCLMIGLFVSALLVSQLSAKMVRVQTLNHDRLQQMDLLTRFLSEQSVPHMLAQRIQHQVYERASLVKPLTIRDLPSLAMLPGALRSELSCAIYARSLLSNTVIFAWCANEPEVITDLCSKGTELEAFSSQDEVFLPQQEADKVYCIQSGHLRYFANVRVTAHSDCSKSEDNGFGGAPSELPTEESGPCGGGIQVGKGQWVSTIALWCQWTYAGTLQSTFSSEMVVLVVKRVLDILARYPPLARISSVYAHAASVLAGSAGTPDILDLDIKPARILSLMPVSDRSFFSQAVIDSFANKGVFASGLRKVTHLSTSTCKRLEGEVEAGKSVVTIGPDNAPLRTVLLSVVEIRNGRDELLVKVASQRRGGDLLPDVCWPSTKLQEGETSWLAAQRLIEDGLPHLDGVLHFERKDEDVSTSRSHSVHTEVLKSKMVFRYQEPRTEVADNQGRPSEHTDSTNLDATPMSAKLSSKVARLSGSTTADSSPVRQALGRIEFLEVDNGRRFELFAWMKYSEFQLWCNTSANEDLKSWLSKYRRCTEPVFLLDHCTTTSSEPPVMWEASGNTVVPATHCN